MSSLSCLNISCRNNQGKVCMLARENCIYKVEYYSNILKIGDIISTLRKLECVEIRRIQYKVQFLKQGDDDSFILGVFLEEILSMIKEPTVLYPKVSGIKGNPYLVEEIQNMIHQVYGALELMVQDKMEVIEPAVIESALEKARELRAIFSRVDVVTFM